MLKVFSCSDAQISPNLILPQSDADTSLDRFLQVFLSDVCELDAGNFTTTNNTKDVCLQNYCQIRPAIQLLYLTCYTNILKEMMQNSDATV